MVMLPSAVLTDMLLVDDYQGTAGDGSHLYGTRREVPAFVTGHKAQVTLSDGTTASASMRAFTRPEAAVPLLSRVLWGAETYRVVASEPLAGLRGIAGYGYLLAEVD
jgi:hypothetical protein